MVAPLMDVSPAPPLAEEPSQDEATPPPPPFDEVFAECTPLVWRALRRLGVQESDVEDAFQEVFVVVHRRLGSFAGRAAVRTWVHGICLRVASDYRRQPRHARERPLAEAPERALPADQDAELDKRRALAWLDEVLDKLDDDKRAVYVLYEIEGLPMADVAAAAGCPVQTAYARLYAARRHVEAAARREQARRTAR